MADWIDLAGKRAVATAGTKGVGEAVMTTACSRPANFPIGVHFVPADLTTAAGCADLARAAHETLGGVHISSTEYVIAGGILPTA